MRLTARKLKIYSYVLCAELAYSFLLECIVKCGTFCSY